MSAMGASASSHVSLMAEILTMPASAARDLSISTESVEGSTTVTLLALVASGKAKRPAPPPTSSTSASGPRMA